MFKKLVYSLMVASPALSIVTIGLMGRMNADARIILAYEPVFEHKLAAYRPLVGQVQDAMRTSPKPEVVNELVQRWTAWREDGTLAVLHAQTIDDSSSEGVKGQIYKALFDLVSHGRSNAKHLGKTNPDRAADAYFKLVELLELMKYFDFDSVRRCGTEQRHMLFSIDKLNLSPMRRERFALDLKTFEEKQQALSTLSGIERVNLGIYSSQMEKELTINRVDLNLKGKKLGDEVKGRISPRGLESPAARSEVNQLIAASIQQDLLNDLDRLIESYSKS